MTLQPNMITMPLSIINVYTLILTASDDLKDSFTDVLRTTNARVGSDHASWPLQLGHHGVGSVNKNGQRVLELGAKFDLCFTSTYFCGNLMKRMSWCHPHSGHWHQLNLVY